MSNVTRFRPPELESSNFEKSKFLGFLPVAITGYEDRSSEFDWADVFLQVTLQIESSQYPVEMKIVGSYDREPNGNIKSCTVLKRLYWLFDQIGYDGGPNVQGDWVDEDGDEVTSIESVLNESYLDANPLTPKMVYYAYVYKEPGKKDPSKSYTTVYPRLLPNTDKGRSELESYIAFLKGKNLIKEVDSTTPGNSVPPVNGDAVSGTEGPVRF